MGNLKYVVIALGALIALVVASQLQQSGYATRAYAVFPDNKEAVHSIELWTKSDTLSLEKQETEWSIADHDSLELRPNKMDPFFERVLGVKKETMVSRNPRNWEKYSVDDSTGTHIRLRDAGGEEMTHAVFGRSSSDWSHNYVRTTGSDEVFLTNESVIHLLYPRATYWGQKPKPDTTVAVGEGEIGDSGVVEGASDGAEDNFEAAPVLIKIEADSAEQE